MRQALHGDGLDAGVGDDHFLFAEGCGVAVVGGFGVGMEQFADAGQAGEEFEGYGARNRAQALSRQIGRGVVFEALGDFGFEAAKDGFDQRRGLRSEFRGMHKLFVEEARKEEPEQVGGDERNGALGRQVLAVQVVDAAYAGIGGHEAVGELGNVQRHKQSIR